MTAKIATATYDGPPLTKAELHYTSETGKWQTRHGASIAARIDTAQHIVTPDSPTERPFIAFFTITGDRRPTVSNVHVVIKFN